MRDTASTLRAKSKIENMLDSILTANYRAVVFLPIFSLRQDRSCHQRSLFTCFQPHSANRDNRIYAVAYFPTEVLFQNPRFNASTNIGNYANTIRDYSPS